MPFSLLPKIIANRLTDITPELLHTRDIRLLMLDFDNTIVPYTTDVPTAEMTAWLDRMKQTDITVCIVSNSHKDRVPRFCREHGLDASPTRKSHFPRASGSVWRNMTSRQRTPRWWAIRSTPIPLGANCVGVTSILVSAINNHNFWLKARHVLELPFILPAKKRRM